jgi:hypothetical protein
VGNAVQLGSRGNGSRLRGLIGSTLVDSIWARRIAVDTRDVAWRAVNRQDTPLDFSVNPRLLVDEGRYPFTARVPRRARRMGRGDAKRAMLFSRSPSRKSERRRGKPRRRRRSTPDSLRYRERGADRSPLEDRVGRSRARRSPASTGVAGNVWRLEVRDARDRGRRRWRSARTEGGRRALRESCGRDRFGSTAVGSAGPWSVPFGEESGGWPAMPSGIGEAIRHDWNAGGSASDR